MPTEQLRKTLEKLHSELEETQTLDAESQRLLAEVMRDIESLLANEESDHTSDSLLDRLRSATGEFEESHPTLTEAVGRVADVLSRMGI
jgi:CII-binding regulator of phage lambda lysogenization HflD